MKHINELLTSLLMAFSTATIVFSIINLLDSDADVTSFGICALGILVGFIGVWIDMKKDEKNMSDMRKQYDIVYSDIKSSVISEKSASEKNSDILELMFANMREINDYYILSKTQAKKSFNLAVFMCIIGIILMGVSILATFFQSNNVISAIIPAVGAAIVEVIAGTSLIVYKNSLSQLNRYFNSLHSNERFLSIVNIVSKASPEVQDDMYFEIIKSQIGLVSTDLVENANDENNV